MAKPIVLITIPKYVSSENCKEIADNITKRLEDYHVLVFADPSINVFEVKLLTTGKSGTARLWLLSKWITKIFKTT